MIEQADLIEELRVESRIRGAYIVAHGARGQATEDISHMWEILTLAGGNRNGHKLIRYLDDRNEFEQQR